MGPAVRSKMGLHAEIPLVVSIHPMHLRIPFLLVILRRTGSTDAAGIHKGPSADLGTQRRRIFPDPGNERRAQPMGAKR